MIAKDTLGEPWIDKPRDSKSAESQKQTPDCMGPNAFNHEIERSECQRRSKSVTVGGRKV
jgi:hypothetical protein